MPFVDEILGRGRPTRIDGVNLPRREQAFPSPGDWRDEHDAMLEAVRTMRQSMAIVSRASPRNARVIGIQLERSSQAQRDFERAVRDINASR